ncbi:MAG: MMPL family transporter [Hyphomicrobiales bacterium]|nr:MMPL family transporter [Hyphomicrobiales bacterium]MCP5373302.1 MMPL family transporter [Hyphomicrobiales bacterium]
MSTDTHAPLTPYPLGEWTLRNRWLVIILSVLVTVATGIGAKNLTLDADARVYFSEDNPDRIALDKLEADYSKDSNVMIVITPKDGKVFSRRTLGLVKELTEAAWKTPHSRRVDSVTNYQYSHAVGEDLVIEDLVGDLESLSDEDLARLGDIALTRKPLMGRLINKEKSVTAVNVTIIMPDEKLAAVPQIAGFARDMVEQSRAKYPDHDFHLTGGVMIDLAFAEGAESDIKTLIPAMLVLIMVIVGISLRTFWGTIATLLVIIISVVTSMGAAGWLDLVLNSSTTASPVILMTLSVAHSVHILASIRQQTGQGVGKNEALIEAMRINMSPVFITSLTTAIGFLSLNFSDSPPFRELGNLIAFGVTAAFVYSMFFAPAVMSLLPIRPAKAPTGTGSFMDKFGDFVIMRRRMLLIATSVIAVVTTAGVSRLTFDDDFIKYFDHRFQFRVDADYTQQHLTGLHALEFSLPAGEEQGVVNPDYLNKLDAFAEWYRQQENVVHVSVVSDTIKRLNQNLHNDDETYYAIPDSQEAAAQYLMLYEMSVPFGLDLNSQMDVAKSASRVTVALVDVSASKIVELAERGQEWLAKNAPNMQAHPTGVSMAISRVSERNIKSMLKGTFLALFLISAVLWLVLRDFRIAVISLAPNVLPAMISFGIWGYMVGEVNLAISVVIAMTLGIVVDDTVHLLSKYLRARREHDADPVGAVRYALSTVGIALIVTSVALVVGFGALATSGFAVNGDMGLLSAITIAVALATDFLFLPPLLIMLDRRKA